MVFSLKRVLMNTAAMASNPATPFGLAGSGDNAMVAARWGGNDNDDICGGGGWMMLPRQPHQAVF